MLATKSLQEMIRIPSVNPNTCRDVAVAGEERMGRWLTDWLRRIGAEVEWQEVETDVSGEFRRFNVIGRWAPRDGRARVVLGPHLDTVSVEGMENPFGGEIRDGKIWGRGASDTKGSIAAMVTALERVGAERLRAGKVALDFVGLIGEETCQSGSKAFAREYGGEYELAICGEPTEMDVVHVTKGAMWVGLRADGVSAHSSRPELGENAAVKLMRGLLRLQDEWGAQLVNFSHPMLGVSTMNVGVIGGGTEPNRVPDVARGQVDVRVTPDFAACGGGPEQNLREWLAKAGVPLEVDWVKYHPPMETDVGQRFLARYLAKFPQQKGVGAPWFSDAAHLAAAGVPSVCMGPGSIAQAHKADEFLEVDALELSVEQFVAYFEDLLQG